MNAPGRRASSPIRGAGVAAAGRALGAPRTGSAMGRDAAEASARAAGSAKPPSSTANRDLLLESVLSAAEEPGLGAGARDGIRSVLADAVATVSHACIKFSDHSAESTRLEYYHAPQLRPL